MAYGKRVKIYPLAQAANSLPTKFIDAADVVYDSTIPYDLRFFRSLDEFAQREPWLERDKAMIDQLKSIGIEKGKPFNPGPQTRQTLDQAATEAHAWLDAQYETVFSPPSTRAVIGQCRLRRKSSKGCRHFSRSRTITRSTGRGILYSFVYFSAKHLGAGQFYLMTIADKEGRGFDGAGTYRLTVPANPPVSLYWSATVYDRATHAFIRNLPRPSRSSLSPDLQKNTDGSVAIWFGPSAPAGKESNWVPTKPGGEFEVLFRFYGPEKPLFDKTWQLPDIEKAVAP